MTEFGVFYQVYKNHKAVRFVLENFRKPFPDTPVVLLSAGGDDFNNYPKFPYNAYRTIEWWKRQKLVCEETGLDYTMIMEDDVYVRRPFNINPPFSLRGVRIGNQFTGKMITDIYNCTNQISTHYVMCVG